MSEFKVGDRVHIEFIADGEVSYTYNSVDAIDVTVGDESYTVPISAVSKAGPALPTKVGSVIRITSWHGATGVDWTAILTVSGWFFSAEMGQPYAAYDIETADADFEVVYVPEN